MSLGENLKSLRKASGLTQAQLGAVLGVDRTTYSCYEKDKASPSLSSLVSLAGMFGITVDELILSASPYTLQDPDAPASPEKTYKPRFSDLNEDELMLILRLRAEGGQHMQEFLEILTHNNNKP